MYENLVLGQEQSFGAPLNQFSLQINSQQALYSDPQYFSPLSPTDFPHSPYAASFQVPSPPATLVSSDGDESHLNEQEWIARQMAEQAKSKAKEDEDEDEEDRQSMTSSTEKHPSKRRMAHNLVEKRYRNTINSEMERLRRMVPQIVTIDAQTPDGRAKASKATVLSSAVRYIQDLESDRHRLARENEELRIAVGTFTAYRG